MNYPTSSSSSSDSDEDDVFVRRRKIYRNRLNHFENFDDLDFFTRFRFTKPKIPQVEIINNPVNNCQDAELEIASNDWLKYTPYKLKTPMSKKLRQKTPIPSYLQNAKINYYLKKTELLEEEIKHEHLEEEDRTRKRHREEEEHEMKMKILRYDLKLKETEFNSNKN